MATGLTGAVDFLHNDVEEYQHVDADVEEDEAKEVAGELVTLCSLIHVEGKVEHQPGTDQHGDLVEDLDEVVQTVVHWAHRQEVAEQDCAEDVRHCHLQHDG